MEANSVLSVFRLLWALGVVAVFFAPALSAVYLILGEYSRKMKL